MALSRLDVSTALVVIDMQKGIAALPTVHPSNEIAGRVARLAAAFRGAKLPVVLVNVAGLAPGRVEQSHSFEPPADWAELLPRPPRNEDAVGSLPRY